MWVCERQAKLLTNIYLSQGNPRELMLKKLGDVREQRKLLEERLTQIKDSLPQLQQQLKEEQEREKKLRGELDTLRRQRS